MGTTRRSIVRNARLVAILAAAVLGHGATASAQPPEVAIGYGGTHIADGSDLWGTGLDSAGLALQGSVPLTPRFSLEVSATFSERKLAYNDPNVISGGIGSRTERSIGFNVKQRLRASELPGFHAFLTYGVMGTYARNTYPERTIRYPNGSQYTVPAYMYEDHGGIPFPTVGGGFQKELGRHAAVRVDVQAPLFIFLPIGVRASVGMVVPIGAYDAKVGDKK